MVLAPPGGARGRSRSPGGESLRMPSGCAGAGERSLTARKPGGFLVHAFAGAVTHSERSASFEHRQSRPAFRGGQSRSLAKTQRTGQSHAEKMLRSLASGREKAERAESPARRRGRKGATRTNCGKVRDSRRNALRPETEELPSRCCVSHGRQGRAEAPAAL
jgi:hypothetical protein